MEKTVINLQGKLSGLEEGFKINLQKVRDLMDFDEAVYAQAMTALECVKKNVSGHPLNVLSGAVESLKTMRAHGSLKGKYSTIYNQCLVLLVSYFGDSVSEIFSISVPEAFKSGLYKSSKDRLDFKVNPDDLARLASSFDENIGDLLISKENISFQDMQSIYRAFLSFFNFRIEKKSAVDDLIFAQAARHVIVHAGGRVSFKMMEQIKNAEGRKIKKDIHEGQVLEFSPEEIKSVSASMLDYIDELSKQIQRCVISRKEEAEFIL